MDNWELEIRKRLASLDLEPTREAAIVEELAQHLDDRYRELLARGASAEEARRLALAELNQSQVFAQEIRRLELSSSPARVVLGTNRRSASVMGDIRLDVLYGMRMLRKRPGFALVAVATLALGIGVNTAIFTLFDFVLRPMPVTDPDSVVKLEYRAANRRLGFSFNDYVYYRDSAQSFS